MNRMFNGNFVESPREFVEYEEAISPILIIAARAGKSLFEATVKVSKRLNSFLF